MVKPTLHHGEELSNIHEDIRWEGKVERVERGERVKRGERGERVNLDVDN